ncbi:MAG TPA: glycosyltransferase family 39 protein [Bacteroidales bacterium]|nr:glycosyltransferase family 39 protein [Bacteroidales bacterium]
MKTKKPDRSQSEKHKNKKIPEAKPAGIKISGNIKVLLFLLVLVFVLYGNTIPNHYALDDEFVTDNNPVIHKGLKAIPEIFTTRYVSNDEQNYDYRPVVKLSFALEYALFKDNPHASHFINVLLYFLLCFLLFVILKLLLQQYHPWLPLMIIILFAAHPVHTEVVASLKNRDELLSMIGALATWYFIIEFVDNRKWYWLPLAFVFFFLGYFSKSNIIVYAAIIPLSLYFFREVKLSKVLMIFAALFVISMLFNYFPRVFLSPPHREMLYFENPLNFEKGLWLRLGTGLVVVLFYIRLLIFPHPLLFYYGYDMIPVVTPFNTWAIVSFIICLAALAVALYFFRRRHIISFGILFFFITISAFANIIKPPPGIVAERFALSASLGFVIVICALIFIVFKLDIFQKTKYQNRAIKYPLIVFLLILIPYTLRTIIRNKDWKDYKTLYSHDIGYLGKSAKANVMYASLKNHELYRIKDPQKQRAVAEEAKKHYELALKIYPGYAIAQNNLGIIYFRYLNETFKALNCWKKAAASESTCADAFMNMATAFDEMKISDSAEFYYKATIRVQKKPTIACSKLGDLYYRQGKVQEAIAMNEKIMETDDATDVPYINIGNYYMLGKDTINAIAMWEKAIEKQPGNPKLCTNLARYFEHIGDFKKADYYYRLSQKSNSKK